MNTILKEIGRKEGRDIEKDGKREGVWEETKKKKKKHY